MATITPTQEQHEEHQNDHGDGNNKNKRVIKTASALIVIKVETIIIGIKI